MTTKKLALSVLNLVSVREGQSTKETIQHMVDLAQYTETLGYERYWIAEHHNINGTISSATSMLINHTLEQTKTIRVGSGGVMLPNHFPLVVAEQFGTLETIHPNRVDLGVGRAPGADPHTGNSLRRALLNGADTFQDDIAELLRYFGPEEKQGEIKAYPAVNTKVPLYILGSSTSSAKLAAKLGLPYSFAGHFPNNEMGAAIATYRNEFQPSEYLDKPYVIIALNVIAAESNEEAHYELTTMQQMYLYAIRNQIQPLQPPVTSMDDLWSPMEKQYVESMFGLTLIGDKEALIPQLQLFQEHFQVDELMATSYLYDFKKQKNSFKLLKEAIESL
ncbi:LLM class flavin-dependent oxidoreductase [Candidatus Enterococcus ikei]|uniref:LLM class flavin-dependent oxidoreductase n=1 Tax=Candidatus Enterococcus ikei TaxID=2815326 RepID=A0ABS3H366_9ENTE|nr:LLM class flavin-dependent oxidoreductase [Enterococcus sp. DIV0869a]MBO0441958.1 LLM class flavin-dependent oxidoreductase [Enterococcus sp. DIV0869a]